MKLQSLFLFLILSYSSYAQPGTLDGDFDGDGILLMDHFNNTDIGYGVVQDANGNLLVCGYTFVNNDFDWFIKRMFPDGSNDNSFGLAGLVVIARN